jgi:hypothetical protein
LTNLKRLAAIPRKYQVPTITDRIQVDLCCIRIRIQEGKNYNPKKEFTNIIVGKAGCGELEAPPEVGHRDLRRNIMQYLVKN